MFFGEFTNAVDEKNRVAIPARFREAVEPSRDGETYYLSRGLDGCLYLLTEREWEHVVASVRGTQSGAFGSQAARTFARFIFSGACRVEPDKQARILIPEVLRQHAEIDREVTFVGVCNRIEIWARERWERQQEEFEKLEDMAEELFKGPPRSGPEAR